MVVGMEIEKGLRWAYGRLCWTAWAANGEVGVRSFPHRRYYWNCLHHRCHKTGSSKSTQTFHYTRQAPRYRTDQLSHMLILRNTKPLKQRLSHY